mgnify:CR=1 FL=1
MAREIDLTGIDNVNEYYTNHYLNTIFADSIDAKIKIYKEEIYYEIIKLIDETITDDNIVKKDVMYMHNLQRITSYYVQECAIFEKEKECVEE